MCIRDRNYIDPSGNDISIYKFGTGYSLIPDDKVENIMLGLSGFAPYVDSCIVNIDTWLMNKQVEEFEYVDESDEFEQSLSYISTLATTVSLMSLAMEFPVISKVSGDIANLTTGTKLALTVADRSPYISQITYHMFSPYLVLVNTKENLLNRYKAFYNYVVELIDSGALTYTTFFCKVIEDSIIIIDPVKYKEVTNEIEFDLNQILNQYS